MIKFKTTKVFRRCVQNKDFRINVFQGSARASKTYNILLFLIIDAVQNDKPEIVSIVRKTMPALRSSAMRDFFGILEHLNLYNKSSHNKTHNEYKLNNTLFEFFSTADEMRLRGRERHKLFVNEANELDYETYFALESRTLGNIYIDYNPSHQFHWLYDKVIPRDDCAYHRVTYKDNPFLPKAIIKSIQQLKETDQNLWKIFGLGERGVSTETIYTYKTSNTMPNSRSIWGLDFGFNHPSALVEVRADTTGRLFAKEHLYEDKLTTAKLVERVRDIVPTGDYVFCDHSEPATILELSKAGVNAQKAKKQVYEGIMFVKTKGLTIVDSPNLEAEARSYSWKKTREGIILDEPVKFKDDAIDALRYAAFSWWGQGHSANQDHARIRPKKKSRIAIKI